MKDKRKDYAAKLLNWPKHPSQWEQFLFRYSDDELTAQLQASSVTTSCTDTDENQTFRPRNVVSVGLYDVVVMPTLIFSDDLRLNMEAYNKSLEEVRLSLIKWMVAGTPYI